MDYCFLTTDGTEANPELVVEAFDAKSEQNDYEVRFASFRDGHFVHLALLDSLGVAGRYR